MVFEEILIDGVFMVALLAAVACLVYLVYATLLERRVLSDRRTPVRANAARSDSSPVPARRAAATAEWQRSPRATVLREG